MAMGKLTARGWHGGLASMSASFAVACMAMVAVNNEHCDSVWAGMTCCQYVPW